MLVSYKPPEGKVLSLVLKELSGKSKCRSSVALLCVCYISLYPFAHARTSGLALCLTTVNGATINVGVAISLLYTNCV